MPIKQCALQSCRRHFIVDNGFYQEGRYWCNPRCYQAWKASLPATPITIDFPKQEAQQELSFVRKSIHSVVPAGYEDETGFHYGRQTIDIVRE